jgi:hypothetical protein
MKNVQSERSWIPRRWKQQEVYEFRGEQHSARPRRLQARCASHWDFQLNFRVAILCLNQWAKQCGRLPEKLGVTMLLFLTHGRLNCLLVYPCPWIRVNQCFCNYADTQALRYTDRWASVKLALLPDGSLAVGGMDGHISLWTKADRKVPVPGVDSVSADVLH